MNLSKNTVLVTGGASGIGLALAERFLTAGSEVIICGRNEDKLREAQQKHPGLHYHVGDLAQESERLALVDRLRSEFPTLNVVVHNAGIQQRLSLTQPPKDWSTYQQEIAINLEAPIHLTVLLIPDLSRQANSAFITVSSGLAFAPLAMVPVYCATKAALHSFTQSLRHQLATTSIRVIEVIPPAVNTDLGGPGLHTFGVPVDEFADAVMHRLEQGDLEIGYGTSEKNRKASRQELDEQFNRMNNR
ncbi:SDR family oxidoreductase [Larkinella knui]|uniref:SDR family NAD(P)-dependent oxidoreductase n=1 Tax=Larkinella knui TaxID=2025310 RepID=A0A3P1CJJ5_9BACT|nr:SDR family NAD(P)-dependent oxidoreductase [Larkinella knui]RRB13513.1 SDR family NAD(P)-dependent oxidoreductase [Larkinella knui]